MVMRVILVDGETFRVAQNMQARRGISLVIE